MLSWDQIVGHARNKAVLEHAVGAGRLHHALLFSGPYGVGKRALAIALAASINCVKRSPGSFASGCGVCPTCRKISQGIHADVVTIEPEGNIIKNIKIAQIRAIQKLATLPPFEAREQVIVINDAHLMGDEAANALLKTLEEPSARMRLVLVTDQAHVLLDTIRSRCQLMRFGALTREEVAPLLKREVTAREELKEVRGAAPAHYEIAAAFGEGSVGRALEILASGLLEERAGLIERLQSLRPNHPIDYLNWAEELAKDKEKRGSLMERLDAIKVFLRDVMRYQVGGERAELVNVDLGEQVARWARAQDVAATLEAIDAIHKAQELLSQNVNAQLVMERTLRALRRDSQQLDVLFAR